MIEQEKAVAELLDELKDTFYNTQEKLDTLPNCTHLDTDRIKAEFYDVADMIVIALSNLFKVK